MTIRLMLKLAASIAVVGALAAPAQAQSKDEMTFFITSAGPGNGANLGGLKRADAHCAKLARSAGSKKRNWRAYLSVPQQIQFVPGSRPKVTPGVNARDRIGKGPWHNAKGILIAL